VNSQDRRILVLGATGMLGNAMLRLFAQSPGFAVSGSARSPAPASAAPVLHERVITGIDVEDHAALTRLFAEVQPHVVINCVGLVKQLAAANDPLAAITINSLLPHRLARACEPHGARLIHISTDCVFAGTRGMYRETDPVDAQDLYGRSKHLGEVDYPQAITLRTSIIGHELASAHGLVGWFLAQTGTVRGFTRAIFSGVPTVELARIIRDLVVPRPELRGLYHVSAAPIAKYDLLRLVARIYGRNNEFVADDQLVIDRSLDSTRFRSATGYSPPSWPELVRSMYEFA
jgi:dTDP-4-dehydrorhamnose reductase